MKYDVVSTLKYDVETTLKDDVETTLKSDVETTLKSDVVSTLKPDVISILKYDVVSKLKYDIVSTLCLKQVVILNLPFDIVHSGIRQKESLLPMYSSPRDRSSYCMGVKYTNTMNILGLRFIYTSNKLQHGHVLSVLLEMK